MTRGVLLRPLAAVRTPGAGVPKTDILPDYPF
jgi:hypothetical protein